MKLKTGNFIKDVQEQAELFNADIKKYSLAEQEKFANIVEEQGDQSELFQEVNQNITLFDLWTDKD